MTSGARTDKAMRNVCLVLKKVSENVGFDLKAKANRIMGGTETTPKAAIFDDGPKELLPKKLYNNTQVIGIEGL